MPPWLKLFPLADFNRSIPHVPWHGLRIIDDTETCGREPVGARSLLIEIALKGIAKLVAALTHYTLRRYTPGSCFVDRALVTAHLVASFKHLWSESWGPRLEHILRNAIALLADTPGSTLLGLSRLLVDESYRARLLSACRNPVVRYFWTREITEWGDGFTAEAISPAQNKIGALLSPLLLRNIIGQPRSTIDLPTIMNGRRVLIANLSKATLGEGPAHLLGAFLATAFAQAAEGRAKMHE